jgi:ribosomal protein S18 acetylase RimI-like enzyme
VATVDIRPFEEEDAAAIARLSSIVEWPSLTDPEVVRRMCTAPGSVAYVAEQDGGQDGGPDGGQDGGQLVGWAQALGDGVLQSHLGFVAVHPDHRRRGIGRLLVVATFQATRTKRMDLITDVAQGFYATFAHKRMSGFRIYPGA